MTTTVTITRSRHALEGQSLVVIGHFRRHGRLELLVVLGDGSKRLIPAEWTDHHQPETTAREGVSTAVPETLGTTADLLVVCGLVSALLVREGGDGAQAARQSPSKEDFHAARTAQSAPTAGPCAGEPLDRSPQEFHSVSPSAENRAIMSFVCCHSRSSAASAFLPRFVML